PYIRAPAPPVPQAFSVIAPLAIPPVFVVPPTPLARTPATTYPTQIIEYEVAQFLTGIASAPPLMAANPQAAYLRTPPFVQEPSTDIAQFGNQRACVHANGLVAAAARQRHRSFHRCRG